MSARVIRVIETKLEVRGKGTQKNPVRSIVQYWSQDGDLLAEVDSWRSQHDLERIEKRADALCSVLESGCHGGQPDAYVKALRAALDRKE